MPLLLGGESYEWPRRKVTDALDEFCEAVKKTRAACNKKVTPLEDREVKNIPGNDPDLLVVVQREFGMIAGDKNTKLREATVNMPHKIASVDASTCLIVTLTNPATGDVTVAHLDADKQVDRGVADMLKLIGVPSVDCKSAPPGAQRSADAPTPVVKVAMLGAVVFYEYSHATLSTLLKKFINASDVIFDIGHGFDVAVWQLNYIPESKNLKRRGLMIDVSKNTQEGQCVAVECQGECRTYPDARLRALRSFAKDPSLSCVTLFKGEESGLKINNNQQQQAASASASSTNSKVEVIEDSDKTEDEKKKAATAAITSGKAVVAPTDKTRSVFKVVVRPFHWPPMLHDAAKKSESWFYQLSSTPAMEPADFANSVKQAVIFGNIYSHDTIFASSRPRLFVPSGDEKKWAQL